MRTIFILGIVGVCMFMAGWFTIHREDGSTTIKINKDEIRKDAGNAITKGRNYLDRDRNQQPTQQAPAFQGEQIAQQPQYGNTPPVQYQNQQYDPQFQQPVQYQQPQYQQPQYQSQQGSQAYPQHQNQQQPPRQF